MAQTPMVVGHEFYTAWIAQTKLEHPVEVVRCPRCGCTVADVNRGIERHSEEAEKEL
jgi:4-hydroxy-3-methylbut-2-en-1-yl diphosphate synthase IspG/GcpE